MIPALRIERPALEGTPAAPGDILSPSQVSSIMDCAYRWHAKHVLKMPEPPTSNQILGRAVHAALAANFEQKCDSKVDLPVLRRAGGVSRGVGRSERGNGVSRR